jgi:Zn-dependent protease
MLGSFTKRFFAFLSKASAVVVGAGATFVFCIAAMTSAYEILDHSRNFQGLGIVLAPLYVAFCVVVHECGHVIAARLCGWNIHLISILGLAYRPAARRFERTSRGWGARSGFVFATPRDDGGWDRSWAGVLLGGAAANFAGAGILYALIVTAPIGRHLAAVAGALALCSLTMGFANLVPFGRGPHRKSDGGRLLDMLLGRKFSAQTRDAFRMTGLIHDRIPVERWDTALIARMECAQPDPHFDVTRIGVLLNYHLTRGDVRRARDIMERWAEANPVPESFVVTRAFLIAIVERDADKAEKILAAAPQAERKASFHYWRAEAAILALQGRHEAARMAAAQARASAAKQALIPDADDEFLLSAIERADPLPDHFAREAA